MRGFTLWFDRARQVVLRRPCAGCPPDASRACRRRSASTRAAVGAEPSALAGWLILTCSTRREPLVASIRRTVRCRLCCLRRERWRRSVGAAAYTAQTSAPARLPCVSWAAGRAASSAEASEKRVERAAAGRWRTLPQGEAAARRYGVDRRCLTHGRRGAIRRIGEFLWLTFICVTVNVSSRKRVHTSA